jgi:tRNA pseudouridine55 synthase
LPVEQNLLSGLLVVDKPGRTAPAAQSPAAQGPGAERLWTSHDVVARVRRISGQRRIGHTGTLDPAASGVLLLCLGAATRLVEYYQGETKRYYAEVVLGAATDTYDAEGSITATAAVPPLTAEHIEAALRTLRGEIWQEPPAYSAIKQGGEALYAKARRGEAVSAEARLVTFARIDLLELRQPNRLLLDITCSAGAYIRSLAHDLGRALGVYGYLDVLRRLAVGEFGIEEAYSLAEIEEYAQRGELGRLLRAAGEGLPLPVVRLPAELLRRLGHGQHVPLEHTPCPPDSVLAQARDETGALAGIIRCLPIGEGAHSPAAATLWKAEKWLL